MAETLTGIAGGLLGAAAFTTANWDVVGMTSGGDHQTKLLGSGSQTTALLVLKAARKDSLLLDAVRKWTSRSKGGRSCAEVVDRSFLHGRKHDRIDYKAKPSPSDHRQQCLCLCLWKGATAKPSPR